MSGRPEGLPAVEARVSELMRDPCCRLPKAIKKIMMASGASEDDIVYSEEADTWAFCWMPALDDFLESENGRKGAIHKSYNEILLSDRTFHNPHALEEMAAAFGMAHPRMQARSFLIEPPEIDEGRFYADDIRDLQNKCYADEKVKAGVELNRDGKYQEALKMYEQALSTCPRHVDAFVARGAAKANLGQLRHAMEDFEEALRIDPGVQNARDYLQTIRAKLGSSLSDRMTSQGRGTTPSPHRMPSSVRAAREREQASSLDHYVDLTDEPLSGRKARAEPGAQAGEYSSTIGKLEQLIRAEEGGSKRRKKEKRKHRKGSKKKRRRDNSSASEAESTEEEDDDDGRQRQEKKKKKKGKKKRRKKRKRQDDSEDDGDSSAESSADVSSK